MTARRRITVDGNEAVASVAHRLNEVIVLYPITPSSPMGELADEWSAQGKANIWGQIPDVVQMQSEAGAAGAVHGSLQTGSLTTTFTASQGLLLMIPNLYKIVGELTPCVFHIAARSLATHALSIFGDHQDVMACRQTGAAMLASNSPQEAHDMACIAHAATLKTRVPILHFMDGFRTSHEIARIEELTDDDLRAMIDEDDVAEFRHRALTPDAPKIRGTAQNPDAFFQAREACNPIHAAVPEVVQQMMDRFAKLTGRQYRLFEYVGAPDAERVIVIMGSGAETVEETVKHLMAHDEKVGVLKVRLYRPFDPLALARALPCSAKRIAVLDRTKEPGSVGEPLYVDFVAGMRQAVDTTCPGQPSHVIRGRYGLSSKEFTPAMVKAVFDELAHARPKNEFTIGIVDDVTHLSLPVDESFNNDRPDVNEAIFYGLGADGTVGANKNTIKIIGEDADQYAQGYFVYDSKKSGAMTISHLRFGPRPIRAPYLIRQADFVGVHQWHFVETHDVLEHAAPEATFLLNAPYGPEEVWDHLPRSMQEAIIEKRMRFFVIDAYKVAQATGMGRRINTIMQTCHFAISGVLPRDKAIDHIKQAIQKTYGKKGADVVQRNCEAVDQTLEHLHEVNTHRPVTARHGRPPLVPAEAPDFVQRVTRVMLEGKGDLLPVSAFPVDGTFPVGTTKWEKRNIAVEIPIWDPDVCIQCNKCALACPHAAIRAKVYDAESLDDAPDIFQSVDYKAPDLRGLKFTIQVAPEDCTGCNLCVNVCPAKNKAEPRRKAINMESHFEHVDDERVKYDHFLAIPEIDRSRIARLDAKGSQFLLPLFEYSGACAGCGETPYIKLLTQLYGDRLLIANATGCTSIYGGNLPTTPYCANEDGRGPAWANSLFEDNAEFGYGFRVSLDQQHKRAVSLVQAVAPKLESPSLVNALLAPCPGTAPEIQERREQVEHLRRRLRDLHTPEAILLDAMADHLVPKSVWLVGGDGWAYDIGFGGLDHVMANTRNVNMLVLDTEVYSNTGGQQSKATPLGAAAKFASSGKEVHKKDLGLIAMSYGHVYVASIAMGANDNHTVKVMQEAESFPGPSLIVAYSHCIAHGYDLSQGFNQQKLAVNSGVWPLYRYDPRLTLEGKPPLQLDAKTGSATVHEYMRNETRFRMVERIDPKRFRRLAREAQRITSQRIELYRQLADLHLDAIQEGHPPAAAAAAGSDV